MPSIPRTATAFLSILAASAFANAAPAPDSMEDPRLQKRALTYVGCFSSSTPLTEANTYEYQSQGYCSDNCEGTAIGLTNGDTCYCGTTLPAEDDKVDDSNCDTGCTGWGQSMCGGDGFWTVYETQSNVPYYQGDGDSSSSSTSGTKSGSQTSSNAPTIVTSEVAGGSTIMVTVTPTSVADASQPSGSGSGGGGGSNTAGIAAGVVVGVVAIVGAAVGIFFLLRHRKQKQAEEDFKQRTQVSDFMRGASERKPPGSGYSGTSDSRLDPEANRRNSVGSLADNQDYSRRILRVANPDSS